MAERQRVLALTVRPLVATLLAVGVGVGVKLLVADAVAPPPGHSAGFDGTELFAGLIGIVVGFTVGVVGMTLAARRLLPRGRRAVAVVCATIAPYVVAVLLTQVAPFARGLSAGSVTVAAGLAVLGTAAMLLAPSGVFLLFGMMGGAPAVTRSEFVRPMDILPPIPPRPPEGQ